MGVSPQISTPNHRADTERRAETLFPSPRRGEGQGEGVPTIADVITPHPALRADLSLLERLSKCLRQLPQIQQGDGVGRAKYRSETSDRAPPPRPAPAPRRSRYLPRRSLPSRPAPLRSCGRRP